MFTRRSLMAVTLLQAERPADMTPVTVAFKTALRINRSGQ